MKKPDFSILKARVNLIHISIVESDWAPRLEQDDEDLKKIESLFQNMPDWLIWMLFKIFT